MASYAEFGETEAIQEALLGVEPKLMPKPNLQSLELLLRNSGPTASRHVCKEW